MVYLDLAVLALKLIDLVITVFELIGR